MANPAVVDCPADTWTKVATAVKTGGVWIMDTGPSVYKHTYRDTGDSAPTDDTDAIDFEGRDYLPISSDVDIDVYIKPARKVGRVRVDS